LREILRFEGDFSDFEGLRVKTPKFRKTIAESLELKMVRRGQVKRGQVKRGQVDLF
jgi:hypothetical protein